MLTERVVREEDLVVRGVRDHVIGPVHHHRGSEGERALADAEALARLHREVTVVVAVMGAQALLAVRRARDDRGVRRRLHDGGDGARVVLLHVVGDDVLDLARVDDVGDALEQIARKRRLARVDERHVLVEDEVGVVRRSAVGRVAVEVALVPVDAAHPVHIGLDLNGSQHKVLRSKKKGRDGISQFSKILPRPRSSLQREAPSRTEIPQIARTAKKGTTTGGDNA